MDEGDVNENLLALSEEKIENNGVREEISLKKKIWNESKKVWIVAGPAIFTRCSMFGINVISQAFVGHIGSTELAAYSLVFTVLLRFANGVLLGMSSGLETLCGQAFGAKQQYMLGLYLQQSWIVLTTTCTLLLPIFIFASPILKALGQEENIANVAGPIGHWFIPVIYSYVISFSCQMYLQAQSKNMIIAYLAALSLVIHLFLSWLLTVCYKFGILGAMISTVLAYWIPNAGQIVYVVAGGCKETWRGFTSLAFKDLWPLVKFSITSGVMLCLELWYNSILLLLTGNLKNAEVAIDALSICLNISVWAQMISIGFYTAASVRVSNELGRKDAKAVKFSIVTLALTSFAIAFVLFLFFILFRGGIAYIFTTNLEVAKAVAHLSPLLAISILLNSVRPVLSGVAVGAGWQSIVAYFNLGSYYLIGIPFGIVLGYVVNLQVEGVWIGMLTGTLVQTIIVLILTCRTDWNEQVSNAQNRLKRWSVKVEPSDEESRT